MFNVGDRVIATDNVFARKGQHGTVIGRGEGTLLKVRHDNDGSSLPEPWHYLPSEIELLPVPVDFEGAHIADQYGDEIDVWLSATLVSVSATAGDYVFTAEQARSLATALESAAATLVRRQEARAQEASQPATPAFKIGDHVAIQRGVFSGRHGVVIAPIEEPLDDAERFTVAVDGCRSPLQYLPASLLKIPSLAERSFSDSWIDDEDLFGIPEHQGPSRELAKDPEFKPGDRVVDWEGDIGTVYQYDGTFVGVDYGNSLGRMLYSIDSTHSNGNPTLRHIEHFNVGDRVALIGLSCSGVDQVGAHGTVRYVGDDAIEVRLDTDFIGKGTYRVLPLTSVRKLECILPA